MYFEFLKSLGFTPPATPGSTGSASISGAGWTTYDSTQELIWVATGTKALGINPISLSTVVTSVTFSSTPQIVYDPTQNLVWVADATNNTIKAISPITGSLVTTCSLTISPVALVYDAYNNNIWYSDSGSKIGRINASNGSLGTTISTAHLASPASMSYDDANNRLWYLSTVSAGNNALSYIPGSTNTPVTTSLTDASLSGSEAQTGCFYDPQHNVVWVTTGSGTTNHIYRWDVPTSVTSGTVTLGSGVAAVGTTLDGTNALWACLKTSLQQYNSSTLATGLSASILATVNVSYDSSTHRLWASQTTGTPGLYWYQLA